MEKTKKKKILKILAAIFVPPLVLAFALWCWVGYELNKFDIKPEVGKYELRDDVYSGELEITKISKKEYKAANGINVFTDKKGKKFYRIKCAIGSKGGVLRDVNFINLQIIYGEPNRPDCLQTEDGIWMIRFGYETSVYRDYDGHSFSTHIFCFYKI